MGEPDLKRLEGQRILPRQERQQAPETSGPGGVGFWDRYDLLPFRNPRHGKEGEPEIIWRQIEPGAFPLVDGISAGLGSVRSRNLSAFRVGRLKGYGNAIVEQLAAEFIMASMEAIEDYNKTED